MNNNEIEYKSRYTAIFSAFYFLQGMSMSIFGVIIPIYLIVLLGMVSASDIAILGSIIGLPWAAKIIFGILSDKIGFKDFGRRRLWIIVPGIISGIVWILMPTFLLLATNVYITLLLVGLIANIGISMGDTAIDGLILDICPKQ